jgi:molybdopterin-containing oxidoreductase family membrane subunit
MVTTTLARDRLPYGVGRIGRGWTVLALVAAALLIAGIYAYSRQLIDGEVVTGLADIGTGAGATWGLYVMFLVYFISVSFAGISIAALIRLFNVEHLKPLARIAELVTIISIFLGALLVIIDLGQPLRGLVNLWLYARPGSPLFYTFALVMSGYLFASIVFFYLAGRRDAAICAAHPGKFQWFHKLWAAGYRDTPAERDRHHRTSWWLALAIMPLLVIAHSVLGFVFGSQAGQPGWFSALQAPGFVVVAGVAGIGLVIVVTAIIRKALRLEKEISLDAFRWLANLLWVMTIAYIYLLIVEVLTATYTSPAGERSVADVVISGQYAWAFWLSAGLLGLTFVSLFLQWAVGRYSLSLIVLAAVMANVVNILKRYVIVVPSQTHGTVLPYTEGSYSPTWIEYAVILGLVGLGILLFIGFMKVFPILETPERFEGGA